MTLGNANNSKKKFKKFLKIMTSAKNNWRQQKNLCQNIYIKVRHISGKFHCHTYYSIKSYQLWFNPPPSPLPPPPPWDIWGKKSLVLIRLTWDRKWGCYTSCDNTCGKYGRLILLKSPNLPPNLPVP